MGPAIPPAVHEEYGMPLSVDIENPDAPGVAALLTAWAAERGDGAAPGSSALTGPETRLVVAREDGRAVGCVVLVDCGTLGEIRHLFVLPAQRRGGVARAMMAVLESEALRLDLRRLRIVDAAGPDPGSGLYRGLGYLPCTDGGPCLEKTMR